MNNKQNQSFQYTYSAVEQEKIKEIRSKYAPRQESKLEKLERLDAAVTQKATLYSLILGIAGTLILGLGMSLCMVWGGVWFIVGIVTGLAGIGLLSLAYPLYSRILKKERARIAPEILRLTDELMK